MQYSKVVGGINESGVVSSWPIHVSRMDRFGDCANQRSSYILQNIVNSTNMIKHYPVGTIHHLPVAGMVAERVDRTW